jgi:hypothetical protein
VPHILVGCASNIYTYVCVCIYIYICVCVCVCVCIVHSEAQRPKKLKFLCTTFSVQEINIFCLVYKCVHVLCF